VNTLPTLTADLPGCGGSFKGTPEDFEVEEIPAYEPNGEKDGEHFFIWIEKRGRSTQDVAKALAQHCGMNEKEVSWAGLKDRQAVTRQYLCAPHRFVESKLPTFVMEGVTVLKSARHRNKLKGGHLKGNRFSILLRDVKQPEVAKAAIARLVTYGIPNYFGEQRFGVGGDNAQKGKRILQAGGRHRDRFERKLFLSAYQSDLFNRVLARRLEAGTFAKALPGDVLKKHETNGEFVCSDAVVDQPRVDSFEVSATGPLFGPEMRRPEGEVDVLESQVLVDEGIERALFEKGGNETIGARRLLRVPLALESVEGEGELRLKFTLPAGSYATVLLRELLKS
jgi:tRNA pseudouridine13 synthase